MLTLQTLTYIERHGRTDRTIWNYKYLDTLYRARYNAKPDCVIHLNCREVDTHASCKTARTQESFNYRGTKMFLLSAELSLITNNSKMFVNGSKSQRLPLVTLTCCKLKDLIKTIEKAEKPRSHI